MLESSERKPCAEEVNCAKSSLQRPFNGLFECFKAIAMKSSSPRFYCVLAAVNYIIDLLIDEFLLEKRACEVFCSLFYFKWPSSFLRGVQKL